MQNHEIYYLKWRIALEKSILDGLYQNLAYMCLKLFSTDSTSFEGTCNQFDKGLFNFKKVKKNKKDCSHAIEIFCFHVFTMVTLPLQRRTAEIKIIALRIAHCFIVFVVS